MSHSLSFFLYLASECFCAKRQFFDSFRPKGFYYRPEGGKSTPQILNLASECVLAKKLFFAAFRPKRFYYESEGGKSTPQILNPASECLLAKKAVLHNLSQKLTLSMKVALISPLAPRAAQTSTH